MKITIIHKPHHHKSNAVQVAGIYFDEIVEVPSFSELRDTLKSDPLPDLILVCADHVEQILEAAGIEENYASLHAIPVIAVLGSGAADLKHVASSVGIDAVVENSVVQDQFERHLETLLPTHMHERVSWLPLHRSEAA